MAKTKAKRPRKGYLMVELSTEQRTKMESIQAKYEAKLGVPVSMAAVVRLWIDREKISENPD